MSLSDYKPVVSRVDMRRLDAFTIAAGTDSLALMELAGGRIAAYLLAHADELTGSVEDDDHVFTVLVATGPGNNGGDGFVVSRLLAEQGWHPVVAICGPPPEPATDAGVNLRRWEECGGEVIGAADCLDLLRKRDDSADIILDCLFGTGLHRPLEGLQAELVTQINDSGLPVVACDMPSGLCADTGRPLGVAVVADATVTLGAAKPGLFVGLGPDHAGRVTIADIGLKSPEEALVEPIGHVIDDEYSELLVPHRRGTTHKGQLGHVLVVGGGAGTTGAALLAAMGALRAGAGLATMAVPASLAPTTDAALPEAMTIGLADDGSGNVGADAWRALSASAERCGVAAVGPGLGTGPGAETLVHGMISGFAGTLVIDADALNCIAAIGTDSARDLFRDRRRAGLGPAILTPHPGEMARLLGTANTEVQANRIAACRRLAADLEVTAVLKGAGTLVCHNGRLAFNTSGNPGMATPGMGDVLSGITATFAAQIPDPFTAASVAVYVHGLAADILADAIGGSGFLASEVATAVPRALSLLRNGMP